MAPMWSSWPWVSTSASTASSRSRIASKSGRIRSTPGVVVLGEQHAAVDDEQAAVVLEDGHVAADLAEAAERDDPQPSGRQRRGCGELGVGMAQGIPSGQMQSGGGQALAQGGHLVVGERHERAADVAVVEDAEQLEAALAVVAP